MLKKKQYNDVLNDILDDSLYLIGNCKSLEELHKIKVLLLGRKGILNLIFRSIYDKTL